MILYETLELDTMFYTIKSKIELWYTDYSCKAMAVTQTTLTIKPDHVAREIISAHYRK